MFMMVPDSLGDYGGHLAFDGQDDAFANDCVLLHACPFVLLESRRLKQNLVRDANFPKVVKLGRQGQQFEFSFR
jgi:hypothetical protein